MYNTLEIKGNTLQERLKYIRDITCKKLGISKNDFYSLIETTCASYCTYIRAYRTVQPSEQKLQRIAKILGIPYENLVQGIKLKAVKGKTTIDIDMPRTNNGLTLGERLDELQKKSGLSQMDTIVKIGISAGSYWRYNKNKAYPTFDRVVLLAKGFGLTLEEFLDGLPIPSKAKTRNKTKSKVTKINSRQHKIKTSGDLVEIEVTIVTKAIYIYEKIEERYDETLEGYKVKYNYENPQRMCTIGDPIITMDKIRGPHIERQVQPYYAK